MARGLNKVMLIGNLGQDPEIRYMQNGNTVTNLNIATSESWKDKQTGENRERTEWHRVVVFGKLAEIANEYCKKGTQVYVEGQLQTRKWQDESGQDRYTTEVIVSSTGGTVQVLGSGIPKNGQPLNKTQQKQAYSPEPPKLEPEEQHSYDYDNILYS